MGSDAHVKDVERQWGETTLIFAENEVLSSTVQGKLILCSTVAGVDSNCTMGGAMTWMKAKVCLNATLIRVGLSCSRATLTIDLGTGRVY